MFNFSNYSTKSKYYNNSSKFVISKIKDETAGIAVKEFVRLKPKRYLFIIENIEDKKPEGVNRNVVATICHNEYKGVLLNNKCIRNSTNRI